MSNSDNQSSTHNSTDKKLDALYGGIQDSEPPVDLDARLMAAARTALESEPSPSPAFWKNRYGWASAAALLLTSTLFISVTDNQPPASADAFSSSVENTLSVEPVTPDPTAPSDPGLGASAQDLEVHAESELPQLRQQERETASRATASFAEQRTKNPAAESSQPRLAADLDDAATVTQSKARVRSAAKSQAQRAQLSQIARPAIALSCTEYAELLIDRVCWFTADETVNETLDEDRQVDQFRLYASKTSDCAGQSLRVQTSEGAPTPHPSSTAQRFVIAKKDPTSDSPQDSIACVGGKLKRQSLARGR